MATDFTLIEVDAIHAAFSEALASAKEREERMPSSAAALRERARQHLASAEQDSGDHAPISQADLSAVRRIG